MADVKTLLGYLVKRMLDSEIASLAPDPSANNKAGVHSEARVFPCPRGRLELNIKRLKDVAEEAEGNVWGSVSPDVIPVFMT